MVKIAVDCHVHSVFSGHAFCTYRDIIMEAAERGLAGIGVTDHFGGMFLGLKPGERPDPDTLLSSCGHFLSLHTLPRAWHGVRLYRGVEIDIDDTHGRLYAQDFANGPPGTAKASVADAILRGADYAVASVHALENASSVTESEGTRMYLGALEHPKVFILGHIGRAGIPFDVDAVVGAAKDLGKAIEINEHSNHFGGHITAVCRYIAIRCAEIGAMIAVNSDAHCSLDVGRAETSLSMLEDIRFPPELIVNSSAERFEKAAGIAIEGP